MPRKHKNKRTTQKRKRRNNKSVRTSLRSFSMSKVVKLGPLSPAQYDIKVNNINEFFDDKSMDAQKRPREMKRVELLRKKELRRATIRRKI